MLKILVVDDDQGLRISVKSALLSTGAYQVEEAFDGVNALEKVRAQNFQMVILDVDMPRMKGLEALRQIKEHDPSIVVLVLTAYASLSDAVQAVKDGAYDYLSKPIKSEELVAKVDKALQAQRLISRVAASAPVMMEAGRKIIGSTLEMQKVFNIIHKLSKVDTPVLIRGASGTGKELVARAIHFNSGRKDQPFVAINCSAIPENLFESELFGHEKGAFTSADQRKIGKFQYAEGGTLFLDELGDLPLTMQVKFLRVLQEKVFTPVGSNREIQSNVRIIAATNRPLEDMIAKGTFREDLFYRLNVIPIFLPALAERKNDIDHMVHGFIRKFNQQHSKKITGITVEALSCLKRYSWPGNIRELENVIEHTFVLENSNHITLASLPEYVLAATSMLSLVEHHLSDPLATAAYENSVAATSTRISNPKAIVGLDGELLDPSTGQSIGAAGDRGDDHDDAHDDNGLDAADGGGMAGGELDFNRHKETFEREFIIKALKTFKGRINQTALHANIPKKTLLRKIEKYGINAKDYAE
jgi:two-component system response regulator HydG